MMHIHYFEAVERPFRDALQLVDKKNKCIQFGGKVVIFGGDFKQILPVVPKGTRQDILHATINSLYLWSFGEVLTLSTKMRLLSGASDFGIDERKTFSEWVLGIGDGTVVKTMTWT